MPSINNQPLKYMGESYAELVRKQNSKTPICRDFLAKQCLQLIVAAGLIIHVVASTSTSTIKLASDGVSHAGQLLALLLEVLHGGAGAVLIEPISGVFDGFKNLSNVSINRLSTSKE